MDFDYIKLPKGVSMRKPYQGEMDYFNKNQHVAGMATEDGKVILNPFAKLKPEEFQAVAVNESARLLMKSNPALEPKFSLTQQQIRMLDSDTYRNASELERKATIAARLLSNDPSAGVPTAEQMMFVNDLKKKLFADQ